MARADSGGERVAAGALDKLHGLFRIREAGVAFIHSDVFFHAAEHPQLCFDADSLCMGAVHDTLGDGDILVEWVMRSVDHHRAVKARINAVVARFLVPVVEMNGENRVRENLLRRSDDGFEHPLIGVFACPF